MAYANMCGKIPCAEQKYMPFSGTVTERACRKKNSKAQEHIQMIQRYALDFFHETRSVTVSRFGFFPGFTDKG